MRLMVELVLGGVSLRDEVFFWRGLVLRQFGCGWGSRRRGFSVFFFFFLVFLPTGANPQPAGTGMDYIWYFGWFYLEGDIIFGWGWIFVWDGIILMSLIADDLTGIILFLGLNVMYLIDIWNRFGLILWWFLDLWGFDYFCLFRGLLGNWNFEIRFMDFIDYYAWGDWWFLGILLRDRIGIIMGRCFGIWMIWAQIFNINSHHFHNLIIDMRLWIGFYYWIDLIFWYIEV